ncbi:MAG: arginyl-tRNA synthetase [Microgenomates group bacterium Gr01-1014_5]|nr:MAG: arginyl-tRNA synthetase [Microgenomates group bacterium Gr01-1014_5]
MFVLEGNSAPYLQYTYARTESVIAKSRLSDDQISDGQTLRSDKSGNLKPGNLASEELALLRWIYRFPEVVEEAALNFAPNTVCTYLFELAQRYNTFYAKHRILADSAQNTASSFRLALTQATGIILKTGLHLLGIEAPSKM